MTTKDTIIKQFKKEFINEHTPGEPRFLRGIMEGEIEKWLHDALSSYGDSQYKKGLDDMYNAAEWASWNFEGKSLRIELKILLEDKKRIQAQKLSVQDSDTGKIKPKEGATS